MDGADRSVLVGFIEGHTEEIVERATDWATREPDDVAPTRPRPQVRSNIVAYLRAQLTLLRTGNGAELEEFMRYVAALRAKNDFHMSTMIRACFSLRNGIADAVRRAEVDPRTELSVLRAADEAVQGATLLVSDLYAEALHAALIERRSELETELQVLTQEKLAALAAQRNAMNAVSSPIIEVWQGILVAPLIGEFDNARVADIRERVVSRVVAMRSSVLLVDVTGLTLLGPEMADELGRLVACIRLVGAEAMLVGVSPAVAVALAALHVDPRGIRSFATLRAGLLAALRLCRLRVVDAD